MNAKTKRMIIELIAFVLLIVLDQWTKSLAVKYLKDVDYIWLIKGVLQLHYLPNGNTGAAFGMFAGHQLVFLIIALVVVIVIGYILYRIPTGRKYRLLSILLLFIAAGGVGNMIDRAVLNSVIDFIYISIINFPIFNVADIYVSVSTVILAIVLIFKISEDDYKELESEVKAPFIRKNKDA